MYRRWAKRVLDLIVAVPALLLLMPVMGAIAICVRFKLGTPVIFHQPRAGRNGQPFTLYKFRTMTDERDVAGNLLPPVERLTSYGRFLRSTSMDELPQLWNVVRGDMSLVGPRPLLLDYLPLYTPKQARRHQVRPGVTGWAQVKGRNALTWEEKFALDVWYVDHLGLVLDLKILLLTLERIVRRDDVNTRNGALMPRFMGSQPAELLEGETGEG